LSQQAFGEMTSDETGTACDEHFKHKLLADCSLVSGDIITATGKSNHVIHTKSLPQTHHLREARLSSRP
jgi:hypothetical protein